MAWRGANHMEIYIFARFQAQPGAESTVEEALREIVEPTNKEEGCLGIRAFHSICDPRVFYIHSRWKDEAAFDLHAKLPHTVKFVESVEPLLDHRVEAQRCALLV
jgi:quinol monooxygenase YgiN